MKDKSRKNWLSWLWFLLLIPSVVLNIFLYQKSQKKEGGISVIGILDGDTLVLEGKVRLRLRQVDAPELDFCGGKEAKELLKTLTEDKRVLVREEILDQRGRPMALIYVGETLVNLEMLKGGWVRYHADQTSKKGVLREAFEKAKTEGKGIFSPLCYQKENPQNPNCRIKGNIDKNSGLKKYYFPGCAQYEFTIIEKDLGESWFCREEEAGKAGFNRAETCPK